MIKAVLSKFGKIMDGLVYFGRTWIAPQKPFCFQKFYKSKIFLDRISFSSSKNYIIKTILEKLDKLLPSEIIEKPTPPKPTKAEIKKMEIKEMQDYFIKKYMRGMNPLITNKLK